MAAVEITLKTRQRGPPQKLLRNYSRRSPARGRIPTSPVIPSPPPRLPLLKAGGMRNSGLFNPISLQLLGQLIPPTAWLPVFLDPRAMAARAWILPMRTLLSLTSYA